MAFQLILWNICRPFNFAHFGLARKFKYQKMIKSRVKRKPKQNDINDLVAVAFVALIALLAYKDKRSLIETKNTIIFIFLILLGLIVLIFTIAIIIDSKKSRLGREEVVTLTSINLNWGQAMQHDLLICATPIFILILPALSGQGTTFNDWLQALVAFLFLIYLKKIYWEKAF